jgi:hypothetical protein
MDQQATRRPPIQSGAIIYTSRLKGGQGVTPFLKVTDREASLVEKHFRRKPVWQGL